MYNSASVHTATELCVEKWLRWQMLCVFRYNKRTGESKREKGEGRRGEGKEKERLSVITSKKRHYIFWGGHACDYKFTGQRVRKATPVS